MCHLFAATLALLVAHAVASAASAAEKVKVGALKARIGYDRLVTNDFLPK